MAEACCRSFLRGENWKSLGTLLDEDGDMEDELWVPQQELSCELISAEGSWDISEFLLPELHDLSSPEASSLISESAYPCSREHSADLSCLDSSSFEEECSGLSIVPQPPPLPPPQLQQLVATPAPAHVPTPVPAPVPTAVAAALPLGPAGLNLRLDMHSVMSAWDGTHPFHLRGQQLAAVAAAIPSTEDLQASLAAAAAVPAPTVGGCAAAAGGAAAAATAAASSAAAEAIRRAAAAARKAAERRLAAAFPIRRLSSDKRPRIKGRFVSRAEYERVRAAQSAAASAAAEAAAHAAAQAAAEAAATHAADRAVPYAAYEVCV